VSRSWFLRLSNERRRDIQREASEPIWPTSKCNCEQLLRLHRAHRNRICFRAHKFDVRKIEENNYDYLDISSMRRDGAHFMNWTITSTRNTGTRHPSWIAFITQYGKNASRIDLGITSMGRVLKRKNVMSSFIKIMFVISVGDIPHTFILSINRKKHCILNCKCK